MRRRRSTFVPPPPNSTVYFPETPDRAKDLHRKYKKLLRALLDNPNNKSKRKKFFRFVMKVPEETDPDCIMTFRMLAASEKVNDVPRKIASLEIMMDHITPAMLPALLFFTSLEATLDVCIRQLMQTDLIDRLITYIAENIDLIKKRDCKVKLANMISKFFRCPDARKRLRRMKGFKAVYKEIDLCLDRFAGIEQWSAEDMFGDVDVANQFRDDCELSQCDKCFKQETHIRQFKACGKCKLAVYCSRECQAAHWSVHKKYCKRARKFRESHV